MLHPDLPAAEQKAKVQGMLASSRCAAAHARASELAQGQEARQANAVKVGNAYTRERADAGVCAGLAPLSSGKLVVR